MKEIVKKLFSSYQIPFCFAGGVLLLLFSLVFSPDRENATSLLRLLGKGVTEESVYYYIRKLSFCLAFTGFTGGFLLILGMLKFWIVNDRNGLFKKASLASFSEMIRHFHGVALLFALSAGVFLRLESCWSHTFWNDTYALYAAVMQQEWTNLIGSVLTYCQSAPPAFLVWIKIMTQIGCIREWILTIPAVIASVLSLIFFFRLVRENFSPKTGLVLIFLFSFNPSLVFYAGELKQYSFDVLFTVLLLHCTFLLTAEKNGKHPDPALYGKAVWIGLIGILFSHSCFLVMPPLGAVLFIDAICRKSDRSQWKYLLFLEIMWAVFSLGSALLALKSMPQGMYDFHHKFFMNLPDTAEHRFYYGRLLEDLFCFPWGLTFRGKVLGSMTLLFILLGGFFQWKKSKVHFFLTVAPVFCIVIASFCKMYPVTPGNNAVYSRLILFTTIFIYILIGRFIEFTEKRPFFYIALSLWFCTCVFFLQFFTFRLSWNVKSLYKILCEEYQEGDKIFVNDSAESVLQTYRTEKFYSRKFLVPIDIYFESKTDWKNKLHLFPRKGSFWIFCTQVHDSGNEKDFQDAGYIVRKYLCSGGFLYHVKR